MRSPYRWLFVYAQLWLIQQWTDSNITPQSKSIKFALLELFDVLLSACFDVVLADPKSKLAQSSFVCGLLPVAFVSLVEKDPKSKGLYHFQVTYYSQNLLSVSDLFCSDFRYLFWLSLLSLSQSQPYLQILLLTYLDLLAYIEEISTLCYDSPGLGRLLQNQRHRFDL